MQSRTARRLLAAVLAALFVLAGGTVIVADEHAAPPAAPEPTRVAPTSPGLTDLTSDLRAETGIPAAARRANRAHERTVARSAARQGARASIAPACRTDYTGGVWSSRNGVRPVMFVLHYTVSPNRPGWADVLGILSYFETTRRGSSHFIVDFEGHCLKMVRGRDKAWTQGNANPWAISVEIIATGRESKDQWKASPLFKQRVLARLARSVMDHWGIPLRRVNPVGCVFPAGWTDHESLECGNLHTDVQPSFPYGRFARQLRAVR